MTKQPGDRTKSASYIKPVISDIDIVTNGALQPFNKIFRYEPENAAQESLGTLLGVFEIGDRRDASAYIVNFIASVAKKEFFSQPKRTSADSLESTLHKINLALAELVKQGNTEWLGTLNGVVCAIEKSTLHFSASGDGAVLLVRNGLISTISDGLASKEAAVHPLKTFTETVSGRLQTNDICIITTPELFEILTPQDIERNAKHFPGERLTQFLRTAMVNQLASGNTFVITTQEIFPAPVKKVKEAPKVASPESIPNVFSQSVFTRPPKKKTPEETPSSPKPTPEQPLAPEYVDSQTGHIYVQGETPLATSPSGERWEKWQLRAEELRSRTRQTGNSIRQSVRSISVRISADSRDRLLAGFYHTKRFLRITRQRFLSPRNSANISFPSIPSTPVDTPETLTTQTAPLSETPTSLTGKKPAFQQRFLPTIRVSSKHFVWIFQKIAALVKTTHDFLRPLLANIWLLLKTLITQAARGIKEITAILWRHFLALPPKPRSVVAFVFISGVGFLSWYVFSWISSPTQEPVIATEISQPAPLILPEEPNFVTVPNTVSLWNNTTLTDILVLNEKTLAITAHSVTMFDTGTPKEFPAPEGSGAILRSTTMPDLNSVFLLTDTGKILTFTPINHAFTENNLVIQNPNTITSLSGYLTYLYLLDGTKNQILRYPRATGGFATPTSWLKTPTSLSKASSMTVTANLIVANGDQLIPFLQGKIDASLSFANSSTPIDFEKVTTDPESGAIAVLDTHFGRVILYAPDGSIQKQYATDQLKQATAFALDLTHKQVLFTTSAGLFSFPIE